MLARATPAPLAINKLESVLAWIFMPETVTFAFAENHATVPVTEAAVPNAKIANAGTITFNFFIIFLLINDKSHSTFSFSQN